MITAKKVIPDAKEEYQLSVGISSLDGRISCALFRDNKFLAEASGFNSLEGVLDQLASDLRQNNEHPIPNDAPIKVVNGQLYSYPGYFRSQGRIKPAGKVPFSDTEITSLYFSAQSGEIHQAYLSWKLGI